jgi:putative DNA primase/helicase
MRQDFISFPATHKLIVFGNTYPAIRGSDQSAWKRRLHVLLFQQQFADKADSASQVMAEDRNLREKLQAEAPGVLQKLIKGCLEYQRIGLKPPLTVTAASQRYLHDQNRTARWLSERCNRSQPKAKTKAKDAWEDYKSWCEEGREFICRQHDFYESLENLTLGLPAAEQPGAIALELI